MNNAGRNYTVPALDVELKEIQTTFEANLFGVMLMCQAFGPLLVEAKGAIVQIGSLAGMNLSLFSPALFSCPPHTAKIRPSTLSSSRGVECRPGCQRAGRERRVKDEIFHQIDSENPPG